MAAAQGWSLASPAERVARRAQGLLVVAVVVGVSAAVAPRALAQTDAPDCAPTETDIQQAQALFVAGAAAIDAGRWSDAIDNFSRAYALTCAPSALYNYGVALRALGRHREARDAFARLLSEHPSMAEEIRANAENYRREEAARVAVLELAGIEPDVHPDLSLDGRAVADSGERPLVLETDAGDHSLIARIDEHLPFVWEGPLSDGQRELITVTFRPIPSGGGDGVDPAVIIIPILVGLAIAGGIVAAVVLQDDAQLRPSFPDRTIRLGGT
ncbi:MAG: tol-pal system YbgF family protein [Sandaracinaceae bacterium]